MGSGQSHVVWTGEPRNQRRFQPEAGRSEGPVWVPAFSSQVREASEKVRVRGPTQFVWTGEPPNQYGFIQGDRYADRSIRTKAVWVQVKELSAAKNKVL